MAGNSANTADRNFYLRPSFAQIADKVSAMGAPANAAPAPRLPAPTIPSNPMVPEATYFEAPSAPPRSNVNSRLAIFGAAVLVVIVLIVVGQNAATSSSSSGSSSDTSNQSAEDTSTGSGSDSSGFSADFSNYTASEILDQLVADGYCSSIDPRSGFVDYSQLIISYDNNELRGCLSSPSDNYFFIWAQQSSSDMTYRGGSSYQSVLGSNWSLEFDSSEDSDMIYEIAAKYGGTVQ